MATLLLGAAAPPDFVGCDCDSGRDGAALPSVEAECRTDDECIDGCEDRRCLGGECVLVAPLQDGDRDGVAPPPCGDDCNDDDPLVSPSADELCDGADNDCDTRVDEDARSIANMGNPVGAGDPTSVIVPWGRGFLLTELTNSAMWGIPIQPDGMLGIPVELMRLDMGSRFVDSTAAAHDDGRVLVVAVSDLGRARYAILQRDPMGEADVVVGPARIEIDGDIERVDATAFGASFAISAVASTEMGTQLFVAPDVAMPPASVASGITSIRTRGIASDGTRLVVPTAEDQVGILAASGMIETTLDVAGTLIGVSVVGSDGQILVASYSGSSVEVSRVGASALVEARTVFVSTFVASSIYLAAAAGTALIIASDGTVRDVSGASSFPQLPTNMPIARASAAQSQELLALHAAIANNSGYVQFLRGCGR